MFTPACIQPSVDTSLFGKTAWVYGNIIYNEDKHVQKTVIDKLTERQRATQAREYLIKLRSPTPTKLDILFHEEYNKLEGQDIKYKNIKIRLKVTTLVFAI